MDIPPNIYFIVSSNTVDQIYIYYLLYSWKFLEILNDRQVKKKKGGKDVHIKNISGVKYPTTQKTVRGVAFDSSLYIFSTANP